MDLDRGAARACRRRRLLLPGRESRVKLAHAARTDVGMIRSGNEDNFAVDANGSRGVFIVADGMGGHAAGKVASEMAVQILLRELKKASDSAAGVDGSPRNGR